MGSVQAISQVGQDGPILPAQLAGQNTGFASSCQWPLRAMYLL